MLHTASPAPHSTHASLSFPTLSHLALLLLPCAKSVRPCSTVAQGRYAVRLHRHKRRRAHALTHRWHVDSRQAQQIRRHRRHLCAYAESDCAESRYEIFIPPHPRTPSHLLFLLLLLIHRRHHHRKRHPSARRRLPFLHFLTRTPLLPAPRLYDAAASTKEARPRSHFQAHFLHKLPQPSSADATRETP